VRSINKLKFILRAYNQDGQLGSIPGRNETEGPGFTCYVFAWFIGEGYSTIYTVTTVVFGPNGMPVNVTTPVHSYDMDGNDQINYPTTLPVGVPSNGKWRLIRLGNNTPIDNIVGEPGREIVVPPQSVRVPACPPPPDLNSPRIPPLLNEDAKPAPEAAPDPITEAYIREATICGEGSREDVAGQSLVWTIAQNRARWRASRRPLKVTIPAGVPDSPLIRELLNLNAFSCWNTTYPSADKKAREKAGYDPRSSESAFRQRAEYLKSLCRGGSSHEDVSPAQGIQALKEAGMTEEEAANTFLYLNPKTAGDVDLWAIDAKESARNHPAPEVKWTDKIRSKDGRQHDATLVRIGRHVFVSGAPGLHP
jgi:hypothetical protein